MPRLIKLPAWAALDPDNPNRIVVDSAAAYTAWLAELGVGPEQVDQYWVEVAYQCIKMDLQAAAGRFGLTIRMLRADRFALARFKPGRGVAAATRGKEARAHYARVRGVLPSAA